MHKYHYDAVGELIKLGISRNDATKLRRIAMTLHRWFELECGTEYGYIERDEKTNKTYWLNASSSKRWPTPDRETGAMIRLKDIMAEYPNLGYYIQGDVRGASLYILRPGDIPEGENAECCYDRGIVVCK